MNNKWFRKFTFQALLQSCYTECTSHVWNNSLADTSIVIDYFIHTNKSNLLLVYKRTKIHFMKMIHLKFRFENPVFMEDLLAHKIFRNYKWQWNSLKSQYYAIRAIQIYILPSANETVINDGIIYTFMLLFPKKFIIEIMYKHDTHTHTKHTQHGMHKLQIIVRQLTFQFWYAMSKVFVRFLFCFVLFIK